MSDVAEVEKDKVLEWLKMEFRDDFGGYVSQTTNLPLTLYYDDKKDELCLLDQTRLPYEMAIWRTGDWEKATEAGITGMITRGSQAIGVTGAYCVLLAAAEQRKATKKQAVESVLAAADKVRKARPTAVNLSWAVDRMCDAAKNALKRAGDVYGQLKEEADRIFVEDIFISRALAENGTRLIGSGDVILTHCNAGSLATTFGGSAMGVVEHAHSKGKEVKVVSKETRPRSQGFKLTLWELMTAGVPVAGITDNMVSSSFAKFGINRVLVGADRITKDGSVANKVGTDDIARMVAFYSGPFVVAASYSTLDLERTGEEIPIEERSREEVCRPYHLDARDKRESGVISEEALSSWPPDDRISEEMEPGKIALYNPAFDVTDSRLVSNIVLDLGIFRPERISTLNDEKISERVAAIFAKYAKAI
jgi:methylthioribose-1-phosphate isomerase